MHDATLWTAWYLFLLAIPAVLLGSIIREKLTHRRTGRHRR